ncbi:MAG: HEPN domain-containing protein [Candidatus Hydrogenedentes bacterium]|nr:HEPN domain-containing protein [Candidatus Hydrogenedentota bacterium]
MKEEVRDYIRFRMTQSQETLQEAQILLSEGRPRGAVNRVYYACFYAVLALLWTEGMSARKHRGVLSLFDRYWIKTRHLPAEMGSFFHEVFHMRHEGDYAVSEVTAEEARIHLERADDFLSKVSVRVEQALGQGPSETESK